MFVSVNNDDKPNALPVVRDLQALGFTIVATRGTAAYLRAHGVDVDVVYKVNEGRPNVADQVVNGKIDLIINTPLGRESFFDDRAVRRVAMMQGVACITTLTGASAAVAAIRSLRTHSLDVRALQDYYAEAAGPERRLCEWLRLAASRPAGPKRSAIVRRARGDAAATCDRAPAGRAAVCRTARRVQPTARRTSPRTSDRTAP